MLGFILGLIAIIALAIAILMFIDRVIESNRNKANLKTQVYYENIGEINRLTDEIRKIRPNFSG